MRKRRGALALALAATLAVVAGAFSLPGSAWAADAITFEVGDSASYENAVNQINAADSGEFVISLTDDVSLNGDYAFERNSTTILGNGHTLSGGSNVAIKVEGSAAVSLGQSDSQNQLTIDGSSSYHTMVFAGDSSSLVMYGGTSIVNSSVYGGEGGIQLSGTAKFDMYGGTIKNCKDAFGVTSGGVGVGSGNDNSTDSCTFNMHGGSIENCSGGYGAGVRVGKGGTFVMENGSITGCVSSQWGGGVYTTRATLVKISGGEISGNSAVYGGGIAVSYMKSGFFTRSLKLSGAKIVNNSASSYGGGVMLYNANTDGTVSGCTITGNSAEVGGGIIEMYNCSADFSGSGNVICNNTATSYASDVFLNESVDSIKLPAAAGTGATYRDSGKAIDGWYADNPLYAPSEDAVPTDVSGTLKGELSLVASYKVTPEVTVTFDDGMGGTSGAAVKPGSLIDRPADPTREGYRFDGWYADGSDDPFDFSQSITADVTLHAKWVRVHTVTTDDGQGNKTTTTVDEGATFPRPADPTCPGYTFAGWWVNADLSGDKFDFSQPVTADVTLHAGWIKNADQGGSNGASNGSDTGNDGSSSTGDAKALPQTGEVSASAALVSAAAVATLAGAFVLRRREL